MIVLKTKQNDLFFLLFRGCSSNDLSHQQRDDHVLGNFKMGSGRNLRMFHEGSRTWNDWTYLWARRISLVPPRKGWSVHGRIVQQSWWVISYCKLLRNIIFFFNLKFYNSFLFNEKVSACWYRQNQKKL